MNYLFFYKFLPKQKLKEVFGTTPSYKSFDFTVLHYNNCSYRSYFLGEGRFRVQKTRRPHGFLFDDAAAMAWVLSDYKNTSPDAIIKVNGDDIKWLEAVFKNTESVKNTSRYKLRKFIAERLVDFDSNHTVPQ